MRSIPAAQMAPDELRGEADRLRDRADEVADDNPTASEYHARRADWCEYLARKRDEEAESDA